MEKNQKIMNSSKSAIRPTLDPRLIAREFSSGCMADLLRNLKTYE